MKKIAIIGSTASGKSDLALKIATQLDGYILSIDSLSIYKEIDIASAKPSSDELKMIEHFGIDILSPHQNASVFDFIDEYHKILEQAKRDNKNIIIVGGSSFYLKSMIDGLSKLPPSSSESIEKCNHYMRDLESAYSMLYKIDSEYMKNIAPSDRYRIEKALLIYIDSKITPSQWFRLHPKEPIIDDIEIFNIAVNRETLRDKIALRATKMIEMGIIDEVAYLERKYARSPNSMKAIGIVETLEYLDGFISKDELYELIVTHTAQLAKRQNTFNTHQFLNIVSDSSENLEKIILDGATGEI